MAKKVDPEERLNVLRKAAAERGGEVLSSTYLGSHEKHKFRCSEGHEWEAVFGSVIGKKRTWCSKCVGLSVDPEEQMAKLREAAAARGGELLSTEYINALSKYRFRCSEGHEWDVQFGSVIKRKSWCPKCSGRSVDPEEQMAKLREAASARGGELLSTEYINVSSKYRFRCAEGHEWKTTYSSFTGKLKPWCQRCAGQLVDPEIQMAKLREAAAARGGELLSTEYINNLSKYRFRCSKGHEWDVKFGNAINQKTWCSKCAGLTLDPEKQMAKLREAASARGGVVLSTEFIGTNKKYRFRCAEGHEWEATLNSKVGEKRTWCSKCAGLKVNPKERINILREAAAARGGELLSTEYINNLSKYRFRCSKGHEWETTFNSVVSNNNWCSRCAGISVDPEEQMTKLREAAAAHGGELLSTEYINGKSKYRFRCSKGHEWETLLNSVLRIKCWCPSCNLKTEPLIRKILEIHFKAQSTKIKPDWLKNPATGRNFEIDIWFDNFPFAAEIHGNQHFEVSHYFKKTEASLIKQMERDLWKESQIVQQIGKKNFHPIPIGYDQNGKKKDTWTSPEMISHINYYTGLNIPLDLEI